MASRDILGDQRDFLEDLPLEEESFEYSPRASSQRKAFQDRPPSVGVERLAMYLPFHLYPEGDWGVRFFERPMQVFTTKMHRLAVGLGLGYGWNRVLRIVTYCVARHEFQHYLTELFALDLELKLGRKVYIPYCDTVYKATYPTQDCIEETVANVWLFENTVTRSPAGLKLLLRNAAMSTPWPAYRNGGSHDAERIRPVEDRLAAQVNQCNIKPGSIPPAWGVLPRPFVQPWTRYENVLWTMTLSAGGQLGRILDAGRIRKTMKIYHR